MAKIRGSSKLSSEQAEYKIVSGSTVYFRIIADPDGYRLMTATADEDTGCHKAYGDLPRLVRAAHGVFIEREIGNEQKTDLVGRPYVEVRGFQDADDLIHVSTLVLDKMGIEDIEVLAHREMKAIFDEFAADDDDDAVYLSDGTWMTSDGRLVSR